MDYYLLFIWRDVEPRLFGPFATAESRNRRAKKLRTDFGTTASYFPIELTKGSKISIGSYSETFFEQVENKKQSFDEERNCG